MKNFCKKLLLWSGVLCLTGFLLCLIALGALDFDFNRLDTAGSNADTWTTTDPPDFDNIYVDAGACDVTVRPSPDHDLRVVYDTPEHIEVTVALNGNQLTVTALDISDRQPWYKRIRLQIRQHTGITIYVPIRTYTTLTACTASGDVSVLGHLTVENASITTASGDVAFRIDTKNTLNITTTSGDVALSLFSGRNMTVMTTSGDIDMEYIKLLSTAALSTTSGDISADDVTCTHNMMMDTTSGDLSITGLSVPRLTATTVSGGLTLNKNEVQYLTATSTSGDVELNDVLIEISAELRTVSGHVCGTLRYLHQICARTISGKTDIQRHTQVAQRLCDIQVSTTSGDITLK